MTRRSSAKPSVTDLEGRIEELEVQLKTDPDAYDFDNADRLRAEVKGLKEELSKRVHEDRFHKQNLISKKKDKRLKVRDERIRRYSNDSTRG